MERLQLGARVRWQGPDGGWETGRLVLGPGSKEPLVMLSRGHGVCNVVCRTFAGDWALVKDVEVDSTEAPKRPAPAPKGPSLEDELRRLKGLVHEMRLLLQHAKPPATYQWAWQQAVERVVRDSAV